MWVFDNDGVLYTDHHQVGTAFSSTVIHHTSCLLGIEKNEVPTLLNALKQKHQTEFSILALVREYHLDFDEVAQATYASTPLLLQTDPERRSVIKRLTGQKTVFTANPKIFAERILTIANLLDCFEQIIGMQEVGFKPKTDPKTYMLVEQILNTKGSNIWFVDDTEQNLNCAKTCGWRTFRFDPRPKSDTQHVHIQSFSDLLQIQ